jgi:anti-anti-sigma factor
MFMALTVEVVKASVGVYRIKLGGSLDSETAPQLDRELAEVWADQTRVILLEMHELNFISSVGVGILARIRRIVMGRKGVVLTVGAQPQILRVFNLVKVLPKEVIFANRAEADAYLDAIQKQTLERQALAPAIS